MLRDADKSCSTGFWLPLQVVNMVRTDPSVQQANLITVRCAEENIR